MTNELLKILLPNLQSFNKIIKTFDSKNQFILKQALNVITLYESNKVTDIKMFTSDQKFKETIVNISALRSKSWESLHIGHWSDVKLVNRLIFTSASFIHVILILIMSENYDNISTCLHLIDIALLLGASVKNEITEEDILSTSATILSEYLSHEEGVGEILIDTITEIDGPKNQVVTIYPSDIKTQVPVIDCPSLKNFQENYFSKSQPVVLINCMTEWPAVEKWRDLGYFLRNFGERTVPIEVGSQYTHENWGQKLVRFKDFLKRQYLQRDPTEPIEYLAQHDLFNQIVELRSDIVIPDQCSLTTTTDPIDPDIKIWFGPGGTVSPLHYDKKHNLLSQIVGTKKILITSPDHSMSLYPHETDMLVNTSQVDLENINEEKFPWVKSVPFYQIHLEAGQMLYLPPKWWHHVRALTNSISVSFWWE